MLDEAIHQEQAHINAVKSKPDEQSTLAGMLSKDTEDDEHGNGGAVYQHHRTRVTAISELLIKKASYSQPNAHGPGNTEGSHDGVDAGESGDKVEDSAGLADLEVALHGSGQSRMIQHGAMASRVINCACRASGHPDGACWAAINS